MSGRSPMIESIVAVVLRFVFVIMAFGIMTTFFLLRLLFRKVYAMVTGESSAQGDSLRQRAERVSLDSP